MPSPSAVNTPDESIVPGPVSTFQATDDPLTCPAGVVAVNVTDCPAPILATFGESTRPWNGPPLFQISRSLALKRFGLLQRVTPGRQIHTRQSFSALMAM